jgi:hypothetical protein
VQEMCSKEQREQEDSTFDIGGVGTGVGNKKLQKKQAGRGMAYVGETGSLSGFGLDKAGKTGASGTYDLGSFDVSDPFAKYTGSNNLTGLGSM